jgi:hypothetical protein
VPNSPTLPALTSIARRYFEEYRPLLAEWGRRQNVDKNYQPAKHFPLIQSLQGQLPDDLRRELNELQRKESSSLWDPRVDAKRLFSCGQLTVFTANDKGNSLFPGLIFV